MSKSRSILKKYVSIIEEQAVVDSEEAEFGNMSLAMMADKIMARIGSKPVTAQAELYQKLLTDVISQMKEMPQGERKILLAMKDFKKANL
jgi:hypothetical protein